MSAAGISGGGYGHSQRVEAGSRGAAVSAERKSAEKAEGMAFARGWRAGWNAALSTIEERNA